jgi:hypothetical protein
MPVRYAAITVLRDPVERVISHYRFNSTQPGVFQNHIRDEKLSVIDYYHKFSGAVATQYGVFAPTGDIASALRRLEHEISFFGLQSDFDRLVDSLSCLLGIPTTTYKSLNKTAENAVGVTENEVAELQSIFADDVAFYDQAVNLYRRRVERLPKSIAPHPWSKFYS